MESGQFFYIGGIVLSLVLHVLDQATDVFAALLFYIEGEWLPAIFTLGFVFLPGFFIFGQELGRMCSGKSNVFKALTYLMFSPLWAIVIHGYSLFDHRYQQSALYYKTLEGFLEASPQFALQLALLFKGTTPQSSQMVLNPIFNPGFETPIANITTLDIFGRVYQPEDRQWFGYIHLVSVAISFLSIFLTAIMFNDISPGKSSKGILLKISVGAPFYLANILFRGVGIALLICFVRFWAGVVIFALFFINFLSALSIGDDFGRCCSYALWSLLVPVGFNRDPSSNLGYSKVSIFEDLVSDHCQEPMSEKDIERSKDRAKYFLTAHLVSSILILGIPLLITLIVVQIHAPIYAQRAIFDLNILNMVFLPFLALCLAFSLLFGRPYHRCECSGGEAPSGNWIV